MAVILNKTAVWDIHHIIWEKFTSSVEQSIWNLTVTALVMKFHYIYRTKDSFPCLQNLLTGFYGEQVESNTDPHILFLGYTFWYYPHIYAYITNLFCCIFWLKYYNHFYYFSLLCLCHTLPNLLDLITLYLMNYKHFGSPC
jgi:hypothetical protein